MANGPGAKRPSLLGDTSSGRARGTGVPRVAVVGLGIVGAMTLLALSERGVRCVGHGMGEVGHARGASGGGETRIFRTLEVAASRPSSGTGLASIFHDLGVGGVVGL